MGFNSSKGDDAALVQSGFKKPDRQANRRLVGVGVRGGRSCCLGGWSGLIGVANIAGGGGGSDGGGGKKESVRKRGPVGLVGWRSDVMTRSGTRR